MNYPAGMSQYDNMPQSPYYDNSKDDYIDNRVCNIKNLLIDRGRSPEWAGRVAARFVDIEMKKIVEWN